ncbi:MAG: hypothetical protein J5379_08350 [Clostridiales bacterium]|nr:hypothetical protein [Clostridiales bacterium]
MNKMEKRERTTLLIRVIMTVVTTLAGAGCFLSEKLMLGSLYFGMALVFIISMIFNLFRSMFTRSARTSA